MLIIETVDAVNNLEQIADVPGIDVLFLGPWDMCLSLGLDPLCQPHDEIGQVLQKMIQVSEERDTSAGAGASSPGDIPGRLDQGVTFISYGPDYALLAAAAQAGVKAFRDLDAPKG